MVNIFKINNIISFNIAVSLDGNNKLVWFEKGWCEDELKLYGDAVLRY